jgi:sugar diacid utilization regulator
MSLAVVHSKTATARVGTVVYAVVPAAGMFAGGGERGVAVARRVLRRIVERDDVVIGVGGPAPTVRDLARARREADRALHVLRHRSEPHGVAHYDEVYLESLLVRLVETAVEEGEGLRGPLQRVRDHDDERGKDYMRTLACFLELGGDVAACADRLSVHANTVRYRLRRIEQISGLDLGDPMTRISALVQLRAAALTG